MADQVVDAALAPTMSVAGKEPAAQPASAAEEGAATAALPDEDASECGPASEHAESSAEAANAGSLDEMKVHDAIVAIVEGLKLVDNVPQTREELATVLTENNIYPLRDLTDAEFVAAIEWGMQHYGLGVLLLQPHYRYQLLDYFAPRRTRTKDSHKGSNASAGAPLPQAVPLDASTSGKEARGHGGAGAKGKASQKRAAAADPEQPPSPQPRSKQPKLEKKGKSRKSPWGPVIGVAEPTPSRLLNDPAVAGEWYLSHRRGYEAAKHIIPDAPAVKVSIHATQVGAGETTLGDCISPSPGKLFIRCQCCGEIFSRCNWLPHAHNFSNRPLTAIKILPSGKNLAEAMGEDLSLSMDFILQNGKRPGRWVPPQGGSTMRMTNGGSSAKRSATCGMRIKLLPPKKPKVSGKERAAARGNAPPGFVMETPSPDVTVPHHVLGDAYTRPLVYGYAAQKGYIYSGTRHSRIKIPKRHIEDKLVVHQNSKLKYMVLALADGHGGDEAAAYFSEQGALRLESLLQEGTPGGVPWDFALDEHKIAFTDRVREIFASMDVEYLSRKRAEFKAWWEEHGRHMPQPVCPPPRTTQALATISDGVVNGTNEALLLNGIQLSRVDGEFEDLAANEAEVVEDVEDSEEDGSSSERPNCMAYLVSYGGDSDTETEPEPADSPSRSLPPTDWPGANPEMAVEASEDAAPGPDGYVVEQQAGDQPAHAAADTGQAGAPGDPTEDPSTPRGGTGLSDDIADSGAGGGETAASVAAAGAEATVAEGEAEQAKAAEAQGDWETVVDTTKVDRRCGPRKPGDRPLDDGCTLVINVIMNGWIVNCNVGDSRTTVASRAANSFTWRTLFASEDHSLANADLVHHIVQCGGEFIDDTTGRPKKMRMPQASYNALRNSRVRCKQHVAANDIGVPTERALNLGASMGDLLFKLHRDRPVIKSKPDVSFVRIPDEGKTVLLMATDGLFNYLPENLTKEKQQNDFLTSKVGYEYDIGNSLQAMCNQLVEREERDRSEFDDCLCLIMCIEQPTTPTPPKASSGATP